MAGEHVTLKVFALFVAIILLIYMTIMHGCSLHGP